MNTLPSFRAIELDAEQAILLPERETMMPWLDLSIVNAVNYAVAINFGSVGSSATAIALQSISVTQS